MNDNKLKQNIKNAMENMTESIDVSTQVKLNEIRHAAINNQNNKRWIPFLSLTGMALAVMLVVTLVWNQASIKNTGANGEATWLEDLELLATEAEPEFYQDLDFLTWLEDNQLLDTES